MKNLVGHKIRETRMNSKPPLSQKDLAARLESNGWIISRGTLAKIEAGIRKVTDIELVALGRALKVHPEELLDIDLYKKLHITRIPRRQISQIGEFG